MLTSVDGENGRNAMPSGDRQRGPFVRTREPEPGIWVLRLNRPETMNAWHAEMRSQLARTVGELATPDARMSI